MACPEYQVAWGEVYAKELGRLAQGLPGVVDGKDTLDFITKDEVPFNHLRDVTYGQIVCNYQEEKEYPYQERLVVSSNRINYPGKLGTPAAYMLSVKILLNSVMSTPGANFLTANINNFLSDDATQAQGISLPQVKGHAWRCCW